MWVCCDEFDRRNEAQWEGYRLVSAHLNMLVPLSPHVVASHDLPVSPASAGASPLAVVLVFFNDLDDIITRHTIPSLDDDAPRSWRCLPPLLDNDLRPPTIPSRAPANFAHFRPASRAASAM